jgi:gamma-glutamylcyclotransferase (GGCT)/AIG2-like uncharacterized protein YtfP
MTEWYFAYGSNMNPARMQARGLAFVESTGGQLTGFALRFNKRATGKSQVAYANIVYAPQGCVEGVLYRLAQAADIQLMDPFEGNPVRYSREVFVVSSMSGPINAWVYVANPAMIADGLLPERRYLEHLQAGRQWHSPAYQQWLSSHPAIEQDVIGDAPSDRRDGLLHNV